MVQTTCCGGQECIVFDVSGLADPCMASCNIFYRLPDGSIWLLNKERDGYQKVFVADDQTKIDWNADPNLINGISNRPFKAIGWGLKLDEDGNLTIDKLILPEADWDETDETSKDFIKNKPFQTIGDNLEVTDGQLNVVIPEGLTREEIQQDVTSRLTPDSLTNPDTLTLNYTDHNGKAQTIKVPKANAKFWDFKTKKAVTGDVTWKLGSIIALGGSTTYYYKAVGVQLVNAYLPNVMVNVGGTEWSILNAQIAVYGNADQAPTVEFTLLDFPAQSQQVQSDWDETDEESPAFIKNKPTISGGGGAHIITLEGSPLDLTVGDHTFSAFDSETGEMNWEFPVSISESNWDDTMAVRRITFLEDGIDAGMEIKTYRIVAIEYSLPENNFTIDGVMTYQNMGGEFVYTLKVSATTGGGGGDTSNFVTIDTDQQIKSTKTWGEIVTTGQGENGQTTALTPKGAVKQVQKIAGSNEYTEIEMGYGMVDVTRYQTDGTQMSSALFTDRGQLLSTDRGFTTLNMNSGYTANVAEYCIKDHWLYISVQGARPNSNQSGQSYYTFLTLPSALAQNIAHIEGFIWSNFQGGGTAYAGGILPNGEVQIYVSPASTSIQSNHRFSFTMVLPIRP